MAVVMPTWFVRGRARPSMFTNRVPELQGSNAPSTMSNARVVQWAETPDAHIFKLFQTGLRKEELQNHKAKRTLYISYSKAETVEEGEGAEEQNSSFMRKFKLQETGDLEQMKAELMNETLTVTIPKLEPMAWAPRKIDITGADAAQ